MQIVDYKKITNVTNLKYCFLNHGNVVFMRYQ